MGYIPYNYFYWNILCGGSILDMRTRLTWIQVPKGTTFLNYGIDIDGEVSFFKIAIIDDMDTVGVVVINPDGDQVSSKVMADAEEIIAGFNYNNVFL